MNEEMLLKHGEKMYETLCGMLDDLNVTYTKGEENLYVSFSVTGEDIPMDIIMRVRPETQVITLFSRIPVTVPEDKRIDLSLAVNAANFGMTQGCFDYDISEGKIYYRIGQSYRESIISKALLEYILMLSVHTIDDYNDKFLMIAKGVLSIEQFIESENSGR